MVVIRALVSHVYVRMSPKVILPLFSRLFILPYEFNTTCDELRAARADGKHETFKPRVSSLPVTFQCLAD